MIACLLTYATSATIGVSQALVEGTQYGYKELFGGGIHR